MRPTLYSRFTHHRSEFREQSCFDLALLLAAVMADGPRILSQSDQLSHRLFGYFGSQPSISERATGVAQDFLGHRSGHRHRNPADRNADNECKVMIRRKYHQLRPIDQMPVQIDNIREFRAL